MATAELKIVTAREYARSSKGKGNRTKSINDQHTDNIAAEQEHGPWVWGAPYADTGSGSVQYATKARKDFDRLVADLRSRAFGAPGDILVLWEISRLSRDMGAGTAVVDLCEAGGYLIHITSEERTYNPANYNDHHALNAGINDAEKENRRLSARTRRGVDANLNARDDAGEHAARPHGRIPFGFQRTYELVDGRPRPVDQFAQPEEAELINELFERVESGHTLNKIAEGWLERGIISRTWDAKDDDGLTVTRGGVPFSAATLRAMITRPCYIGLRLHKGQTVKASWDGIVPAARFHAVQRIIEDPARRTNRPGGAKHVLTMTMKCGVCAAPVTVTRRAAGGGPKPPAYQCHGRGCVRIDKQEVDEFVIGDTDPAHPGMVLTYLARPDVYGVVTDAGSSPALAAVLGELAPLRAALKEMEDAAPETLAEARVLARSVERLEKKIAGLEAKERAMTAPNPLTAIFQPGGDVRARWLAAPVAVRRKIAAVLLTPGLLGEARIMPVIGRGNRAVDRIVWHRA
ncbi:recombinase family protein [Streptomyces sp. NPDC007172]|uniref:recombinase family protein n=1 Tax=Streptomyces sp. NPDC007172 TaxID=3364776 RepID=UPI0036903E17